MSTGLPFSYRIRRSQKASRARIVVKPGLVEIVAPLQIPEHKLHTFVHAKQQWVSRALKKMAANCTRQGGFLPVEFIDDALMVYKGKPYPIIIRPTKLKRIKIEFNEGFEIHLPESVNPKTHHELIKEAIIRWMKKEIKLLVECFVELHSMPGHLIPASINIKTQKSRWGSCGIRNDININWLLLMAPLDVLEYVVVHELCHIKVKNHSAEFWELVAKHLPDYQKRRQWLKKQGRSLMLAFS